MIFRLDERLLFPDPALAEDDGLLAIDGDLSAERLILAYQQGIFPWYSEGEPVLWYSPPQRFVLQPPELKISKSMKQVLRSGQFAFAINTNFEAVIDACAAIDRPGQNGTWITADMRNAYINLHKLGVAQSYETWQNGHLVGGLYGVKMGGIFCGESMFSTVSNASKFALIKMVQLNQYKLIDCQAHTDHLQSMGAKLIPREEYLQKLKVLAQV